MSSHIGGARQHTRIVFVKNLNYNTTGADLYNVFGRYGAIRQIRIGDAPKTKGTAYVVYQEMADAKRALDNLNGFHLNDRYLVGKSTPPYPRLLATAADNMPLSMYSIGTHARKARCKGRPRTTRSRARRTQAASQHPGHIARAATHA